MGYYSSVAIALTKEQYLEDQLLKNKLPTLLKKEPDLVKDDAVYWFLPYTKWYDDFPEVCEVTDYLNKLYEQYPDPPFGFIRVGEEQGDIEELGSPGDFDMHTSTEIILPLE
jgi:hypothetical protein